MIQCSAYFRDCSSDRVQLELVLQLVAYVFVGSLEIFWVLCIKAAAQASCSLPFQTDSPWTL